MSGPTPLADQSPATRRPSPILYCFEGDCFALIGLLVSTTRRAIPTRFRRNNRSGMSWTENHLPKISGIRSATETLLPGRRTCHKCGENLVSRCRSDAHRVRALVVQYGLSEILRSRQGAKLHSWAVLCPQCKWELAERSSPYSLPTPRPRPGPR